MNFCTIGCQPTKQTSMWGRVGTVSPHGVDRVCKKFHADILPKQSVICPQRIPRAENKRISFKLKLLLETGKSRAMGQMRTHFPLLWQRIAVMDSQPPARLA